MKTKGKPNALKRVLGKENGPKCHQRKVSDKNTQKWKPLPKTTKTHFMAFVKDSMARYSGVSDEFDFVLTQIEKSSSSMLNKVKIPLEETSEYDKLDSEFNNLLKEKERLDQLEHQLKESVADRTIAVERLEGELEAMTDGTQEIY